MPAANYYYSLNYYGGNANVQIGTFDGPNVYSGNVGNTNPQQTTALQLIGRNYSNTTVTGTGPYVISGYGQSLNQNFLSLLENFANTSTNYANTQVYPNFITGQLLFRVSDTVSGKTNQLMLAKATGNYSTLTSASNLIEIATSDNPATSIRNSNATHFTSVSIPSVAGNVLVRVSNTSVGGNVSPTVMDIGYNSVTIGTSSNAANVILANGNISLTNGNVTANRVTANTLASVSAISSPNGNSNISVTSANILITNTSAAPTELSLQYNTLIATIGANSSVSYVSANLLTGTLTTAAQPNITSVGTLTSVSVTGDATVGGNIAVTRISANGNIQINNGANATANGWNFIGNGAGLTNIPAANITGAVANANFANFAGNVTVAAQPNITSVGTLTSLAVTGTVTAGNLIGANLVSTNFLQGVIVEPSNNQPNIKTLGNVTFTGNIIVQGNITGNITGTSTTPITGGNATFANLDVSTNSNLNGGLNTTNISMTGNITMTSGNISTTGNIDAGAVNVTGNISGGNINTGGVIVATGNITGGNLRTSGNVIANNFTANANITAANRVTAANLVATFGIYSAGDVRADGGDITSNATTFNVLNANVTTLNIGGAATTISIGAATGTTTVNNSLTVTGNISGGNISTGGVVTATGNITGGNLITTGTADVGTLKTTTITTGAAATAGTITGTWTLGVGSKLQATYADLAEYYVAPRGIHPGTVVEFGGEKEIQICDTPMSTRVAGVISTDPAFIMNDKQNPNEVRELVALIGRVPCKVLGTCNKGDLMVSAGGGYAKSENSPVVGSVLGKALENKLSPDVGVIEIVVGRV